MPGVKTEGDRLAVRRAHPPLRAENEELFPAKLARVPAHSGVLRPAENIAARRLAEHLRGQRQLPRRPRRFGANAKDVRFDVHQAKPLLRLFLGEKTQQTEGGNEFESLDPKSKTG